MFIWRASTILRAFDQLLPDVAACLHEIGDAMGTDVEKETIARVYPNIPSISIDYGIMEKSSDVLVISAEFGWNDVGSWDNLGVLSIDNAICRINADMVGCDHIAGCIRIIKNTQIIPTSHIIQGKTG